MKKVEYKIKKIFSNIKMSKEILTYGDIEIERKITAIKVLPF